MEDPASLEPETRACSPRWDPRQRPTAHPTLGAHLSFSLGTCSSFSLQLVSLLLSSHCQNHLPPPLKPHTLRSRASRDGPDWCVSSCLGGWPAGALRTLSLSDL